MWLHVEFILNIWRLSGYICGYMSSMSEKKLQVEMFNNFFEAQHYKNGKDTTVVYKTEIWHCFTGGLIVLALHLLFWLRISCDAYPLKRGKFMIQIEVPVVLLLL